MTYFPGKAFRCDRVQCSRVIVIQTDEDLRVFAEHWFAHNGTHFCPKCHASLRELFAAVVEGHKARPVSEEAAV